jgi:hypothetical protein
MKYSIILLLILSGCTHYHKVTSAKIDETTYAKDCSGITTAQTHTDRDLPRSCVYIKRQEVKSEPLQVMKELVQ